MKVLESTFMLNQLKKGSEDFGYTKNEESD
jgi:hypothetical protein